MLGADFGVVRRRFGAPAECRVVNGELHFAYPLEDGSVCADAVVVTDGVVTRAHPALPPAVACAESAGFVGCSIDEVLARLGRPQSAVPMQCVLELRFECVVLWVADDLVVAARPPLTTVA
jgi:hypothetical protein